MPFSPGNGTQTSVLILQKKSEEEIIAEKLSGIKPYNIFMAVVEKVGHDKRGNTLFKRDEQGNEIWEAEDLDVSEIGEVAESEFIYETESRVRIIDDQSREVPTVFDQWKQEEGVAW